MSSLQYGMKRAYVFTFYTLFEYVMQCWNVYRTVCIFSAVWIQIAYQGLGNGMSIEFIKNE